MLQADEMGADYLGRPFRQHDLVARVSVTEWLFKASGSPHCHSSTGKSSREAAGSLLVQRMLFLRPVRNEDDIEDKGSNCL